MDEGRKKERKKERKEWKGKIVFEVWMLFPHVVLYCSHSIPSPHTHGILSP